MDEINEPTEGTEFSSSEPFFTMLVAEGGLAVVAIGVGWLFGHESLRSMEWSWADAVWGVLATLPMLASMWWISRSEIPAFRGLKSTVSELVVPLFRERNWIDIAAIATCAGVGEELLFRGLIQDGLTSWVGEPNGSWMAWLFAGLLFGLAHPITRTYAMVASAIGLYLGLLWMWTGNLLAPIVAHGLYDFLAILYLRREEESRAVEED